VIQDDETLVAVYPYRDADHSKVNMSTVNVLMLMCGAPGITLETLSRASGIARIVLPRFCGGQALMVNP
jgi:DNA/RNA-binding domain of Phe-tRNA-synthetase-like protein